MRGEERAHNILTASLVALMRRFRPWLDARRLPAGTLHCPEPPAGCPAYMTACRESTAQAASFNENRVYLDGDSPELRLTALPELVAFYRAAGVPRFFVWLSPGPTAEVLARELQGEGFEEVRWTRYPLLALSREGAASGPCTLAVREVCAGEALQAGESLGEAMSADCATAVGQDGMRHFMAFDGDRAVAVGVLARFEDIGYLTFAGTSPAWRGRGAQQALIAARVRAAHQDGCRHVVSETLTMLPHSRSNLMRLGFVEVFDKRVFRLDL